MVNNHMKLHRVWPVFTGDIAHTATASGTVESVLQLMIFQTYGVSSHHDGDSYVCSMDLWFLLHTVCWA